MTHHLPLAPGAAGLVAPRGTGVVAAGLAVAAAAHVSPSGHHLAETPYMGVAFVGFTLACVVLLLALAAHPSRAVVLWSGALCAAAIGAYAVTRLVALPGLADDVGAWFEPWGVLSVASEAVVTVWSVRAVRA